MATPPPPLNGLAICGVFFYFFCGFPKAQVLLFQFFPLIKKMFFPLLKFLPLKTTRIFLCVFPYIIGFFLHLGPNFGVVVMQKEGLTNKQL